MALSLMDVRRIASDVVQQEHPCVDVIGVTPREGSTTSAEVIFIVRDCDEPSRVVIGVSRQVSEIECRCDVRTRLEKHRLTAAG